MKEYSINICGVDYKYSPFLGFDSLKIFSSVSKFILKIFPDVSKEIKGAFKDAQKDQNNSAVDFKKLLGKEGKKEANEANETSGDNMFLSKIFLAISDEIDPDELEVFVKNILKNAFFEDENGNIKKLKDDSVFNVHFSGDRIFDALALAMEIIRENFITARLVNVLLNQVGDSMQKIVTSIESIKK